MGARLPCARSRCDAARVLLEFPVGEQQRRYRPEEATMNIKRIVVPVDFSDHSLRALDFAADLAEPFGSELVVIFALEPMVNLMPDYGGAPTHPPAEALRQQRHHPPAEPAPNGRRS